MNDLVKYISASNSKLIGITGGAGAGKSTLVNSLKSINCICYSADYKFIGDSEFRKELLKKKAENSIDSYIDVCNQYNWWDWETISKDLKILKANKEVILPSKYNRDKGITEEGITFTPINNSKIIYEGALLGSTDILNSLDEIIFIYTDKTNRLQRLIAKDLGRRSLNEILARFLITEYSENKHYKLLFKFYKDKIKVVDENYNFISLNPLAIEDNQYIPLPIIN